MPVTIKMMKKKNYKWYRTQANIDKWVHERLKPMKANERMQNRQIKRNGFVRQKPIYIC